MSAPLEDPPLHCLFIGNSFTARNGLPELIADLAAEAQPPRRFSTHMIVAGGASLRRHWNAGVAAQSIADRRWDFVVLQEQSTLPVKSPMRYHESVRLFAADIATHGARIVLYMTWSRQHARTQDRIAAAVETIAAEVGALVVPVGRAWHIALDALPDVKLYAPDGSHPSLAGSYLAACTFVTALFDRSPITLEVSGRLGIDATVATGLHDCAARAVRPAAAQRE